MVSVPRDTVLIVDDKPTNLDILFRHLDQTGYEVLAATDGETAISQAELAQPDIILLDVMMPGLNGFETCRQLKKNNATRDIPVIFMTALNDINSKVSGFEAGGVDYVTKPIELDEVVARINTHLTIRNLQKGLEAEVAERERINAELQARNEELDAFSHMVAHDLKNPLNVIIGYAALLEGENITPEDEQFYHQSINHYALQMRRIIEDLLILAGVRKAQIIPQALNMADIVTAAQKRLVNMIADYQVKIDLPTEWPGALGYAPWVETIWANYMSNGIKYGGRPPHLELGATIQETGQVRFWVRDNGPGLTPEEREQLFVPFTRLSQVRVEGHGLGLSIVQRIVHRLGGDVSVESDVGQGSCFSFTLPTAYGESEKK